MTVPSVPVPETLLGRLVRDPSRADRITHVEHVPPRLGRRVDWPAWVPPLLVDRLQYLGVAAPWEHQAVAADLARGGSSVVLATGTASGKSLAYLLPVLASQLEDDRATALYLSPTKALASDQLRAVRGLNLAAVRAATYDGDTAAGPKKAVHLSAVLTTADGTPVAGAPVTFAFGDDPPVSATTDATGRAATDAAYPKGSASSVPVTVTYAGDDTHTGSTTTATVQRKA